MLCAGEGLDDEHGRAAVPAHEGGPVGSVAGAIIAGICGKLGRRLMQKLSCGGDVSLAVGVGEQSIVADAVKAARQHVQQEAAHELLGAQAHRFVAHLSMFAVVLPAEGDAAIIQGDEARVGDRHPMGVA
jgi:hypothetical protein